METPVKFTNHQQTLYGILHTPESQAARSDIAIVCLHGWGTYRIGPHRIFVEAARQFCDQGFPCLRFDFRGRGESDGTTESTKLVQMIADAEAAVKYLLSTDTNIKRVILLGLCSGGEVAVGTAMAHEAINGLILWSTPLLGRQANPDIRSDIRKTAHHAKSYWQKLFNPESWKKLVRLQVNFRVILRILFGHYHKTDEAPMKEVELLEKFRFFHGNALFIYGGNDPETPASMQAYKTICKDQQINSEFHVISDANHNFYSLAWKDELLQTTSQWLHAQTDQLNANP